MIRNLRAVTDDNREFERWENEGGKVSPPPRVNASEGFDLAERANSANKDRRKLDEETKAQRPPGVLQNSELKIPTPSPATRNPQAHQQVLGVALHGASRNLPDAERIRPSLKNGERIRVNGTDGYVEKV
jgi:hypothetical protein